MAIVETNRVITRYEADVSAEKRALDDLVRSIDRLKRAKADESAASERHFDQLVLDLSRANRAVEEQAMSWEGLKRKGVGSFVSSLGGGIGKLSSAMTPLNQGLEVAHKVIGLASAGMDAYAKTSAKAAQEVKAVKDELESLKNAIMTGVGFVAMDLLKSGGALNLPTGGATGKAAKIFADYQRKQLGFFAEGTNEAGDPIATLTNALHGLEGTARKAFGSDAWNTGVVDDALARMKEGLDKVRANAKDAAEQAKILRMELAARELLHSGTTESGFVSAAGTFGKDSTLRRQPNLGLGEAASQDALINLDVQNQIDQIGAAIDQVASERRQTLLEAVFGSTEEIDLYRTSLEAVGATLDAFTSAVGAGYEALVTGSEPVGKAMKRIAADAILAAGTASIVDAARETALGFGSLALGPIGGASAAMHFKSAALHAAVAVGAGAVAAGLGAGSGNGGGGGGAPSGAQGGVSVGGGGGGTIERTVTNYIIVGDTQADDSPRMKQRNAERIVELGQARTSSGAHE